MIQDEETAADAATEEVVTADAATPVEVEPAPEPAPAPTNAKTVTVETGGPFQLIDPITNQVYPHDESIEVPVTPFVTQCLSDGRLTEV